MIKTATAIDQVQLVLEHGRPDCEPRSQSQLAFCFTFNGLPQKFLFELSLGACRAGRVASYSP